MLVEDLVKVHSIGIGVRKTSVVGFFVHIVDAAVYINMVSVSDFSLHVASENGLV